MKISKVDGVGRGQQKRLMKGFAMGCLLESTAVFCSRLYLGVRGGDVSKRTAVDSDFPHRCLIMSITAATRKLFYDMNQ
jgi:hypothetical protein